MQITPEYTIIFFPIAKRSVGFTGLDLVGWITIYITPVVSFNEAAFSPKRPEKPHHTLYMQGRNLEPFGQPSTVGSFRTSQFIWYKASHVFK